MFPSLLPLRSQEKALRIKTEHDPWTEVIGRLEKAAVSQSAWQVFAVGDDDVNGGRKFLLLVFYFILFF